MKSDALKKKYDKLLNETKDITIPILDRMMENKGEPKAGEIQEDGVIYEPCGTSKHVPDLDPVDLEKAMQKMDEIGKQVDENPFDYPDAAQVRGTNQPGTGAGDAREKVTLPVIGKPKWFKELKGLVKAFGKPMRKRGREYYDIESLVRNVPEKEAARVKKRDDYVFTIVDTSGSMTFKSKSGRTFMEELSKYIPPIVAEYEGEVLVIDTEIQDIFPNKVVKKALKKAKKDATENAIMLAGGGGTDFDKAYAYILDRQRREKFEALIIVLTDGGVYLPTAMIQELGSTILVAPKEELQLFEQLNQAFLSMVKSDKYPAVKIVAIDFKKE